MLLIIVGFYVLLRYDTLLSSPGRWQQGKTDPLDPLGLSVWQTPSVLENDMVMENSVITHSVFPVITVNILQYYRRNSKI